MAHLRKRVREDGGTSYQIRWTPHPNARERTRTFARQKEALDFKRTLEAEIVRGTYIDPRDGELLFSDYVETWTASRHVAPSTLEGQRSLLKVHISPVLGDRRMASIRRSDIQGVINRAAKTVAPGTQMRIRALLTVIFKDALRDRIISESPVHDISVPSVQRQVIIPTPAEVEKIIGGLPKLYRAAGWIAAGAGLRIGEVAGLFADGRSPVERGGIDWLRKTIHVRQQRNGRPLKTKGSKRNVPIPQDLLNILSDHISEFPLTGNGYLYPSKVTPDGAISPATFRAVMNTRMSKLDYPPYTGWRVLRHFYASALIRGGLDPKTVSIRMGHSKISTTFDLYGHLWEDADDRSRDAIAGALQWGAGRASS